MALNFPDSPALNDIYTDSTSGFSYQWDGVVWQSYAPAASKNISIIDDISGSFDGVQDTFALTVSGTALTPANAQQLRIVLGDVIQDPNTDYSVSGSNLIFTTPPAGALSFSGVSLGPAVPVNTIPNGTVTDGSLRISTKAVVGSATTFTEDLVVSGSARVTGILTVGTGSITIDGTSNRINVGSGNVIDGSTTNQIKVGTGLTVNSSGVVVVGILTASSFEGNLTGTATTATVAQGLTGTPNIVVGIATVNTTLNLGGNYIEDVNAVGALNIDCSAGNYFTKTIEGDSTFTVSNVPASGAYAFTLELTHTSGTVTWFSGVEWPAATPPTLTTGKTHLFMFVTDNGGTRWRGSSLVDYTN